MPVEEHDQNGRHDNYDADYPRDGAGGIASYLDYSTFIIHKSYLGRILPSARRC